MKIIRNLAIGLSVLTIMVSLYGSTGKLYSNLGWLAVLSKLTHLDGDQASNYFELAKAFSSKQGKTWLGAGLVAALDGDEQLAQKQWTGSEIREDELYSLGIALHKNQLDNIALLALRSYPDVQQKVSEEINHLLISMCQANYVSLPTFFTGNQKFCNSHFEQQSDNLIYNGSFDLGSLIGWSGGFYFSNPENGEVKLGRSEGYPRPSLSIYGYHNDRRYGLYQRIALRQGTSIHFSGYFKTILEPNAQARILYIEWIEDGKVKGNQAINAGKDTDWSYYERTFTIPAAANTSIQFYPVLLEGSGYVGIDSIKVVVEQLPNSQ